MPPPRTTTEMLSAALDGDQDAWETLVDDHRSVVWAAIRGAGLAGADADDVFQLAFVRLLERGDSIRNAERLPGWLASVARNQAMDIHRRQRRVRPVDDLNGVADPVDGSLDTGVVAAESTSAVRRALDDISNACQQLLRLLFADPPPTYAAVSEILGMPIGSIGPTRQRCLDELRRSPHLRGTR